MTQASAKAWEKVQAAALEMLETGDTEALSYRAIAARAGVALSTVQYYFPSRDELLESLLDGYYGRMRALFDSVVADAPLLAMPPSPDALETFIAAAVDRFFDFARGERQSLRLRNRISAQLGRFPVQRDADFRRPITVDAEEVLRVLFPNASDLRFTIQSLVFLVAHYALLTPDEARALLGVVNDEELERRLRLHLRDLALRMIGLVPR